VHNAEAVLEAAREHGSFKKYLRSHGDFEQTVADLKRRFKFLGDTGAYFFLHVVGEEVPPHEQWMRTHGQATARRPARVRR
jgi:3-methyladenine DNA glycosylase Tag